MSEKPNEASFLKDVSKHEMAVLLDNGIYRHLRFKQPGSSNQWFDIVTWPGFLAYTGDMGSFVFARLDDMFRFFRTDSKREGLGINLGYWGEKLEAVDRCGRTSGHRQFSEQKMRKNVEEHVTQWIEYYELSEDDAAELKEAVEDEVYRYFEDGEYEAHRAVRDFDFKHDGKTFQFQDAWEWSCEEYTYRFVWCCYAIAWAIKQYDSRESAEVAA